MKRKLIGLCLAVIIAFSCLLSSCKNASAQVSVENFDIGLKNQIETIVGNKGISH